MISQCRRILTIMTASCVKMYFLLCLCLFLHQVSTENNIHIVNAPTSSQLFLNAEKVHMDNLQDDSASLEAMSESQAIEDVITSSEKELKYSALLNAQREESTSSSEFFENPQRVNTEMGVAVNENEVANSIFHKKITNDFLDAERRHNEVLNMVPMYLKSASFKIEATERDASPNLNVCGTVNLNKIVDELLDGLRKDIVDRGYDKIKIPDIHEVFIKKVSFMKVKGYFTAEDGSVKNLSTIHRTADVIASSQGNVLTVTCGFGLSDLELAYDKYRAKFLNVGPTGKLEVSIAHNSLILNASVIWENRTCHIVVNDLILSEFGGLTLNVTGLGPLNWLAENISEWVFKRFNKEIKAKIESTLKNETENLLKNFDCSKFTVSVKPVAIKN